jgi:hypothetical protein
MFGIDRWTCSLHALTASWMMPFVARSDTDPLSRNGEKTLDMASSVHGANVGASTSHRAQRSLPTLNSIVVPIFFVKASSPLGDFDLVPPPLLHSPSPLPAPTAPQPQLQSFALRNPTPAVFLRPPCLRPPEGEEVAQLRRAPLPARSAARSLSAVSRVTSDHGN